MSARLTTSGACWFGSRERLTVGIHLGPIAVPIYIMKAMLCVSFCGWIFLAYSWMGVWEYAGWRHNKRWGLAACSVWPAQVQGFHCNIKGSNGA